MTKRQEKIICAAIWYKEQHTPVHGPINIKKGIVICGHRHPHCIGAFNALTGLRSVTPDCGEYEQGFLTSHNRFVDRKEGFDIAANAFQLGVTYANQTELYSEDLY
jgi:hypothetical protein